MILLKDARERVRFFNYLTVGASGFVVDFLFFNLFRWVINLSLEVSSTLSFILAVINNFTLNRLWTFPDSRSKQASGQLVQFAIVAVIGLAIRRTALYFITEPLVDIFVQMNLTELLAPRVLGENLALAIVVLIVMFWNFFANRYWTFNDVD